MNGIGLLVLIAAAGQISATPRIAPNRDFGWEIDQQNPDRALCYIVQVSPEVAATMQRDAQENTSNMPPELVGRATRIVFRIGNEILPQNPSLEELRSMPLVNSTANVTAQLGGGRMSEVEPNAVVNVQQDRTGPLGPPAFPNPSSARSTPSLPNASGRTTDRSPPMPDYPDTGNSSRQGGSPLANNWPGSAPMLGGNSGGDRSRDDSGSFTDNRFANQNTAGAAGNYSSGNGGINPNSGLNPNYGSPNPPSLNSQEMYTGGIAPIQTPRDGFGTYLGNQGQGKFNASTPSFNNNPNSNPSQSYGDGRFTPGLGGPQGSNSAYPNNSGQAGYDGGRIASNDVGAGLNSSFPSLPTSESPTGQRSTTSGASGADRGNSASDGSNQSHAGSNKSAAFENILPAFFILSLLVNFYLGSLIRKLLTRYRALLANMRGQTSANVLSA